MPCKFTILIRIEPSISMIKWTFFKLTLKTPSVFSEQSYMTMRYVALAQDTAYIIAPFFSRWPEAREVPQFTVQAYRAHGAESLRNLQLLFWFITPFRPNVTVFWNVPTKNDWPCDGSRYKSVYLMQLVHIYDPLHWFRVT